MASRDEFARDCPLQQRVTCELNFGRDALCTTSSQTMTPARAPLIYIGLGRLLVDQSVPRRCNSQYSCARTHKNSSRRTSGRDQSSPVSVTVNARAYSLRITVWYHWVVSMALSVPSIYYRTAHAKGIGLARYHLLDRYRYCHPIRSRLPRLCRVVSRQASHPDKRTGGRHRPTSTGDRIAR